MLKAIAASLKIFLFLFLLLPIPLEAQKDSPIDWIRDLAGDWEGNYEWSGAISGSGRMSATYHLTGRGSAIVENLMIDSQPVMTTVYHMDGEDLRMTHYCAAQNQPRLKASSIDPETRRITFELVDITNLSDPQGGHVNRFEIHLLDENRIVLQFTFVGEGKKSYERVDLTRVKASHP